MRTVTRKFISVFALSVFVGFSMSAQNVEKLYEEAEKIFYEEKLDEALVGYQKVLAENPNYEDADYKAEICSLLTKYRNKPIDEILAFGNTKGKKDKFYHYWLGRVYVREYMFEEAIASWKTFLHSQQYHSREITKESHLFIRNAREKLTFFEDTDNYEIHQLDGNINSAAAELSPAFSKETGELLFASAVKSENGKEEFKIFHTVQEGNTWTPIRELESLGTFKRQHANIEVVNEDGKLFLFSPKKKGDIFFSEPDNGEWTAPVEFDSKVTSAHIESHFHINEHEDRIIFATNNKKTGLDLFQTFRDANTGKWSKPAPFAEEINGPGDEDSPYLSPDEKTLYFSSTGHGSIGGFDVFMSTYDEAKRKWSKPVNLGFPINTPDDEMHFKMNPDLTSGYFSSNRLHSKGDYDIYFFWEIEKVNIEGRIYDATAKAPITDAVIRFTPSQYTDEHFKSSIEANGNYGMEIIADEIYLVEVIRDGAVLYSEEFEIHETGGVNTTHIKDFLFNKPPNYEMESVAVASNSNDVSPANTRSEANDEQVKEIKPVIEKTEKKVVAKAEEKPAVLPSKPVISSYTTTEKLMLDNIYFGFGTTSLLRKENPVLQELKDKLLASPGLRVEIGGHTDNIGTESHNIWVSQKRAEAVLGWLVSEGIEASRLVAKGYGESQPIASNDDEINGRELNRRIEVKVIQ